MRMLDDLKDYLDGIESLNEWEHKFVEDLIIKKEEDPNYTLSAKQFARLTEIHRKYV